VVGLLLQAIVGLEVHGAAVVPQRVEDQLAVLAQPGAIGDSGAEGELGGKRRRFARSVAEAGDAATGGGAGRLAGRLAVAGAAGQGGVLIGELRAGEAREARIEVSAQESEG